MDREKVRKYLRLASLIVFSMMIGSVITIFIKNDSSISLKRGKSASRIDFEPLYETYDTILRDYYKDVDGKTLIDGAIDGMLESLEDKHTSYFNETEKEEFDTELQGVYYGIGAQIQTVDENTVKIIKVFDDSPASKAGLQEGDVFVSIDGKSTDGLDATGVANILRSDTVKKSKIVVRRDNEEKELVVTKANVTLLSVSSEKLDNNIGYISVSLFGKQTYTQFSDALEKLEKDDMSALIIDLRGNTGGYLSTVRDMLELFVDKGQILYQIQDSTGTKEYKSNVKNNINYKIIILVDSSSASASEIMAAAMRENLGAILVGKNTYGKGTVQTTKNLSDGTMIKYTIEKWLTPKGNNIDGEGLKPDYDIDLSEEYNNNPSKENDSQLQKAIELLK